jgi:hypothetical protein
MGGLRCLRAGPVAAEFGDCFLCAGIVDEVLVGDGGGALQDPRETIGNAVHPGETRRRRTVGVTSGQGHVVSQAGGGLCEVHGIDGEPGCGPLVQVGEHFATPSAGLGAARWACGLFGPTRRASRSRKTHMAKPNAVGRALPV